MSELKKIEARKKERERKTQDLQKLISQADGQTETPNKRQDKKLPKKRLSQPARPSKVDTNVRLLKFIFACVVVKVHAKMKPFLYSFRFVAPSDYFTGCGNGWN